MSDSTPPPLLDDPNVARIRTLRRAISRLAVVAMRQHNQSLAGAGVYSPLNVRTFLTTEILLDQVLALLAGEELPVTDETVEPVGVEDRPAG